MAPFPPMKISVGKVRKNDKTQWVVSHKPPGGKRQRQFFKTKTAAEAEQERLQTDQDQSGTVWITLTAAQRNELITLVGRAAKEDVSLTEAFNHFIANRHQQTQPTAGKAYADFIAEKETQRLSRRTLAALKSNVGRFIAPRAETRIGAITRADILEWLKQFAEPRTFNSYLGSLQTFFNWTVTTGKQPSSQAATIPKIKAKQMPDIDEAPAILTVEECTKLLATTRKLDPELIPYIAVCLFAGLRPEREAANLQWTDITEDGLMVRGLNAKDRQRRLIQIHPTLAKWLKLKGELPVVNRRKRYEAVRLAAGLMTTNEKGEFEGWKQDCMRHTFASNHLIACGAESTIDAMGHGDYKMLFSHYRALVPKKDAGRFWRITPASCAKATTDAPTEPVHQQIQSPECDQLQRGGNADISPSP